eukprot:Awhi_evm1s7515
MKTEESASSSSEEVKTEKKTDIPKVAPKEKFFEPLVDESQFVTNEPLVVENDEIEGEFITL